MIKVIDTDVYSMRKDHTKLLEEELNYWAEQNYTIVATIGPYIIMQRLEHITSTIDSIMERTGDVQAASEEV